MNKLKRTREQFLEEALMVIAGERKWTWLEVSSTDTARDIARKALGLPMAGEAKHEDAP